MCYHVIPVLSSLCPLSLVTVVTGHCQCSQCFIVNLSHHLSVIFTPEDRVRIMKILWLLLITVLVMKVTSQADNTPDAPVPSVFRDSINKFLDKIKDIKNNVNKLSESDEAFDEIEDVGIVDGPKLTNFIFSLQSRKQFSIVI